ncbi:MAG: formate dehydrogenase subunit alpha [Candidatus Omnitrophota bacterium]
MDKVTLTINNSKIAADKGMSVLEAALKNNIYIPHLCYYPDLEPVGACRLCMVDIKGRGLVISCKTYAEEGLVIKTEGPEIDKVRHVGVELLMVNNHTENCCDDLNPCKLKQIADYIGIKEEHIKRLRRPKKKIPIDTSNPFFDRDPNKCVLCGICVRACENIQGVSCIDFAFRGYNTTISTFGNGPLKESRCESCGECLVRCPTEALMLKKIEHPSREVKTTCPYCGVGCGIYLGVQDGKIVSSRGDKDNPINKGRLCVKGRFGYDFINHPDRLTSPLIKKNGEFVKVSWEEALEVIAEKFSKYRGEKFAALSSAKCTNEENYILQKFTRAVMGTNNIDHCARLCHAPTVAGLAQSFGSGAMTNSINEIENAACIFAIGTNTTAAHPIIALNIKNAVRNGTKLIVANPKEIDLCRFADIFLQNSPGSDVSLMMGMMRVIYEEELFDKTFVDERCENFDAFKASLDSFTKELVEKTTGLGWQDIQKAARMYAKNKPAALFYAMGLTQHTHGTDNVLATSNLALLTGNVGKPSAGVNPLRGQNNVQGACDMGALPNVYPGYQKVNIPEVQKKFESAWGYCLPSSPGLTHLEIFDEIHKGNIKALYLMGENPVLSEANSGHVIEAIKKLEFFVAQDIFLSESAKMADIVLPAATFAEKVGTFTNTERRVQMVRKAIEPVGKSKADWLIVCEIAKKMHAKGFDFKSTEEIMKEIASLTPSYKGIKYERLESVGLQWPCLDDKHPGTLFLHAEKFATQNGKAKFMPLEYKPSKELPDSKYPFILTTDRSLFHFHTSTMTRRVEGLDILNGQELLNINPKDAAKLGISDGETVRVFSRRGKIEVKAKITDICPEGVTSLTFHFAEVPTNVLTNSARDPIAKIPETKVCAIGIKKLK